MIRTPFCDLWTIEHPIALGGMGSVYSPDLSPRCRMPAGSAPWAATI